MKSKILIFTLLYGFVLCFASSEQNHLNFDNIISLWNKTVAPTEKTVQTTHKESSTTSTTPSPVRFEPMIQRPPTVLESFSDGFKYCLRLHEKMHALAPDNKKDQNTIVKCFKTELINGLNKLVINANSSIKLFNGYLELQKLPEKQTKEDNKNINKKLYSSRVSSQKPETPTKDSFVQVPLKISRVNKNHDQEYYENYQKLLRELVNRKNGHQRTKREYNNITEQSNTETLQKTAKLFESGRKLLGEISRNLQHEEEDIRSLTETILDPDLLSSLNRFTKQFALKVNLYPGITAKMMRSRSDGVTFDLELNDGDDDDDDDEDDEDDDDEARDDIFKKKKKKKVKISKKTLKKLFPYLLIPFMIQAALLPLVLKFLLFVAIKALIAGKLALVLVAFNVLKHGGNRSDDDEYAERMASQHYGYAEGEEYGAWINGRRNFVVPTTVERGRMYSDPYRGYAPEKTS